jgi:hypothetical protein
MNLTLTALLQTGGLHRNEDSIHIANSSRIDTPTVATKLQLNQWHWWVGGALAAYLHQRHLINNGTLLILQ